MQWENKRDWDDCVARIETTTRLPTAVAKLSADYTAWNVWNLRPHDHVDARDAQQWFPATVLEFGPLQTARVHFWGWSARFNMVLEKEDLAPPGHMTMRICDALLGQEITVKWPGMPHKTCTVVERGLSSITVAGGSGAATHVIPQNATDVSISPASFPGQALVQVRVQGCDSQIGRIIREQGPRSWDVAIGNLVLRAPTRRIAIIPVAPC